MSERSFEGLTVVAWRIRMTSTVFVTGASKGLGLALSKNLARRGFTVFAGIFEPSKPLEDEAQTPGRKITIIPLDVTNMQSVREAYGQVASQTDRLDILLNNAGILIDGNAGIENIDFEKVAMTLNTNAVGPLRMTHQFLPLLRKGSLKKIVNISSESGSVENNVRKTMIGYCMSKCAVNMQTKILQNILAPEGFTFLAIEPGWMRTDVGGPDGLFSPDESAELIVKLITGEQPAQAMYVDNKGVAIKY
jgi:NAD(P)-dependent dehydrogenase (short-subunit alcohol dehydrogenase family)